MSNKKEQHSLFSASNTYLVAYNVFQFTGWFVLLVKTFNHISYNGYEVEGLWKETGVCLKIFQTLAILEIFHSLFGIVKSSVVTTTVQLFSRVFVVWGILNIAQSSQMSIGLPLILIAWTITEVVRYSFYFLNILKVVPWILIYFRYTFFIVLYPLGVLGEQLLIYAALPIISKNKLFTVRLPNAANFTFDFQVAFFGIRQ
ncbi:Very-long-chain (3R)-3-hydroxyacyl-CoA dehydratase hpo-8 [Armadillidium nasatum]|uniref:Very-long-chain (3R)-3-hydroxyacyl-CoA dehydratase n=1 Tax=Armadillidium nasatum TaxID=96803 RepID=A0A5N5T3I3_9CRUS|nr:Very-long-chain (3R)-3-hydroxyacyl-CoA dehydratase hpo-8 [Armadillidium nasatum]